MALTPKTLTKIWSKMKDFVEKPTKIDKTTTLVGAFLALQDLIYDFEIIDPTTTFIPSATGRDNQASEFSTPRHRGLYYIIKTDNLWESSIKRKLDNFKTKPCL